MKRFTAVPDVRLQTFSWAKEKKLKKTKQTGISDGCLIQAPLNKQERNGRRNYILYVCVHDAHAASYRHTEALTVQTVEPKGAYSSTVDC